MESNLIRKFRLDGHEFSFELCRRPKAEFGTVVVDQWWMPVTPLYGQRRGDTKLAHNHSEILQLYWAFAIHDAATQERDAQERFLLATLVPFTRGEGSRTIFADAFLRAPKQSEVLELNTWLESSRNKLMCRKEFHEKSRQLLGRTEFPEETQELYNHVCGQLLDEPCAALAEDDIETATSIVRKEWDRLMRTIGRRGGHAEEKIVLDVLSYEARAAFHHCYSVAWLELISHLAREERFGIETARFLRFWHTDLIDSETHESLFHGHVFGLHPASGPFVMTQTGGEFLGDWLSAPTSSKALGRLLHGLFLALYAYQENRSSLAEERRAHREFGVEDVQAIEEEQEERRRGHRRKGR